MTLTYDLPELIAPGDGCLANVGGCYIGWTWTLIEAGSGSYSMMLHFPVKNWKIHVLGSMRFIVQYALPKLQELESNCHEGTRCEPEVT